MNALTTVNNNLPATVQPYDPFAEYVAENSTTRIVGELLKFSKGDYLVGKNGDIMELGTRLVANMEELYVGWIKWKDKKPTEQLMGRIFDGFKKAKREDLGDDDDTQWEVDKDGTPQDPWQETNYLLLKVPGSDSQEALYTFTASSHGGRGAITDLIASYVKQRKMRGLGEMPVVELGFSKYKHDTYGWLKNPTFKIVGWAPAGEFNAAMEEEQQQAEADTAARKAADEDIPF
jgi:hypothetical protein